MSSFDRVDYLDSIAASPWRVRRVAAELAKLADSDGRLSGSNRWLLFTLARAAGLQVAEVGPVLAELRAARRLVRLEVGSPGIPSRWKLENPNGSISTTRGARRASQ